MILPAVATTWAVLARPPAHLLAGLAATAGSTEGPAGPPRGGLGAPRVLHLRLQRRARSNPRWSREARAPRREPLEKADARGFRGREPPEYFTFGSSGGRGR